MSSAAAIDIFLDFFLINGVPAVEFYAFYTFGNGASDIIRRPPLFKFSVQEETLSWVFACAV